MTEVVDADAASLQGQPDIALPVTPVTPERQTAAAIESEFMRTAPRCEDDSIPFAQLHGYIPRPGAHGGDSPAAGPDTVDSLFRHVAEQKRPKCKQCGFFARLCGCKRFALPSSGADASDADSDSQPEGDKDEDAPKLEAVEDSDNGSAEELEKRVVALSTDLPNLQAHLQRLTPTSINVARVWLKGAAALLKQLQSARLAARREERRAVKMATAAAVPKAPAEGIETDGDAAAGDVALDDAAPEAERVADEPAGCPKCGNKKPRKLYETKVEGEQQCLGCFNEVCDVCTDDVGQPLKVGNGGLVAHFQSTKHKNAVIVSRGGVVEKVSAKPKQTLLAKAAVGTRSLFGFGFKAAQPAATESVEKSATPSIVQAPIETRPFLQKDSFIKPFEVIGLTMAGPFAKLVAGEAPQISETTFPQQCFEAAGHGFPLHWDGEVLLLSRHGENQEQIDARPAFYGTNQLRISAMPPDATERDARIAARGDMVNFGRPRVDSALNPGSIANTGAFTAAREFSEFRRLSLVRDSRLSLGLTTDESTTLAKAATAFVHDAAAAPSSPADDPDNVSSGLWALPGRPQLDYDYLSADSWGDEGSDGEVIGDDESSSEEDEESDDDLDAFINDGDVEFDNSDDEEEAKMYRPFVRKTAVKMIVQGPYGHRDGDIKPPADPRYIGDFRGWRAPQDDDAAANALLCSPQDLVATAFAKILANIEVLAGIEQPPVAKKAKKELTEEHVAAAEEKKKLKEEAAAEKQRKKDARVEKKKNFAEEVTEGDIQRMHSLVEKNPKIKASAIVGIFTVRQQSTPPTPCPACDSFGLFCTATSAPHSDEYRTAPPPAVPASDDVPKYSASLIDRTFLALYERFNGRWIKRSVLEEHRRTHHLDSPKKRLRAAASDEASPRERFVEEPLSTPAVAIPASNPTTDAAELVPPSEGAMVAKVAGGSEVSDAAHVNRELVMDGDASPA